MEPKQLQDKLESLDLTKVSGIQWNQEHTWSRLSQQLELSKNRRTALWSYAIAASIVLLIVFMSGYVFLQNSEIIQKNEYLNENQLTTNNIDVNDEDCVNQHTIANQPIIKNSESISIKNILVKPKPTTQKADAESYSEIGVPENFEKIAILDSANSNDNVDSERMKEIIASKGLITDVNLSNETEAEYSEAYNLVLTSKPIEQKKNKFSIKLFQRKNKRNNVRSVPALTLFASK